jgi:hypothetical protein
MNKKEGAAFTKEDEILLDMICSHASVFMEEFDQKDS